MNQISIVETLIGAAVIAVAALFLFFAYSSTGSGLVSGYDVVAKFNRPTAFEVDAHPVVFVAAFIAQELRQAAELRYH